MNHPTLVHLHYTFSSYKYIFAYRLLLLFICFTVDNFIFINLKLLKKKKKDLCKTKMDSHVTDATDVTGAACMISVSLD